MVVDVKHQFVLRYICFCLSLSIFYYVYQITVAIYDKLGIYFRYLTIWGRTDTLIVIFLLYETKRKWEAERYLPLVSVVAVLNSMAVFLLEAAFHKFQFSNYLCINFLVLEIFFTLSCTHSYCYRLCII